MTTPIDDLCLELERRIRLGPEHVLKDEPFLQRLVAAAVDEDAEWVRLYTVFKSCNQVTSYVPKIRKLAKILRDTPASPAPSEPERPKTPMDALCDDLKTRIKSGPERVFDDKEFLQRIVAIAAENGTPWIRIQEEFRAQNKLRLYVPKIIELARDLQEIPSIGGPPKPDALLVHEYWKGAPVASEVAIPPGWKIDDSAIFKVVPRKIDGEYVESLVEVSLDPILITKRIQSEDHTLLIEITWRSSKSWYSAVYPRDVISDSRSFVKTSARGAPVTSVNASGIVEFLRAYEHHNLLLIARGQATSSMGWKGSSSDPTHDGFMCGSQQIGGNGRAFEIATMGDGDDEDVAAIVEDGTMEEWTEAMKLVDDWPVVKLMVYAALATPLLVPVGAPNMIVEAVGPTSRGKTTGMRIAQSVWRSGAFQIQTWNNTVNGFEAKAHVNTDMPLFIDDTKTAIEQGKGTNIAKVIYQFISGRGRGRAARDGGQRATAIWRSIMISTGESPSSDLAKAEGAATRVLSLWSTPTGPTTPENATKILAIQKAIDDSFGHAGPLFVKWLCDNRKEWPGIRKYYEDVSTVMRKRFTSPAASRLANVIAILQTAAMVASAAGCVPWEFKPLLEDKQIEKVIVESIEHATAASTTAEAALHMINSYASARRNQWLTWFEPEDRGREPPMGWLGWWGQDQEGHVEYAWEPAQLKRALKDIGHGENADSILRVWRDLGVLWASKGRFGMTIRCGKILGNSVDKRPLPHWVSLVSANPAWWTDKKPTRLHPNEDSDTKKPPS